jgi:hypothetical protein
MVIDKVLVLIIVIVHRLKLGSRAGLSGVISVFPTQSPTSWVRICASQLQNTRLMKVSKDVGIILFIIISRS